MSEMEKFVLNYTVEMKDAIARLEQLDSKVVRVQKNTSVAGKQFKEFSQGAADEIGKLIPGVDKAAGAMRLLSAEFAAAAVAVAVLGVGVKSVMDLRNQYGAQRQAGMDIGVSSVRLEDYQRKVARTSGGTVDRDKAQAEIKKFSDTLYAAYADPTRVGAEARQFRQLGIDVGARGGRKTTTNEGLTALADKLSKMKPADVQGLAKAIGMSEDFAFALAKLGPSIGKVTELTADEINKRKEAESKLASFNNEVAKFNAKLNDLEMTLGQKLIPEFTNLIDLINQFVNAIPNAAKKVQTYGEEHGMDIGGAADGLMDNKYVKGFFKANLYNGIKGLMGSVVDFAKGGPEEKPNGAGSTAPSGAPGTTPPASGGKPAADVDLLVDKLDEQNEAALENAANIQQAINMFAGAVATFSNAVDEKQAWAAWAGEVGRAGGLATPSGASLPNAGANVPGTNSTNTYNSATVSASKDVGKTQFDDIFEREARRTGLPVSLLKKVAMAESSMNPSAVSNQGAEGLMQVLPSNKKALGVTNLMDPAQNIYAGAQILAENLKAAGGNLREALMMYHGGNRRSNWGPKTQAYPGRVLGESEVASGESRTKLQLTSLFNNVASRLGVPVKQLMQGGINKGDVSFATSQLKAGYENRIYEIGKDLTNQMLTQQARSKLMTELREQQSGLNLMNTYGSKIEDRAKEGPRQITVGERAIIINVAAAKDPETTAQVVGQHLGSSLGDIVNGASDVIKY